MSTEEEIEQEAKKASLIAKFGVSPIAFVVTVVISLIFLPTFILMLGGMIPSIVGYILDDTKKKSKSKAIAYLNLAGCFMVGMELWTGDNSVDAAIEVFFQPVNWVIMYGMGMFGWILIRSLNPFIVTYLRLNYQVQQRNLRNRRKYLLNEWGEAVTAVSASDEFIYDNNVYLDDDEVTFDPDEALDKDIDEKAKEPEEPLKIEHEEKA